MKKVILFLSLLVGITTSAQQYNSAGNPNELKINVGWFIGDGTFDASYEHFLNEESSFGATIYYDADSSDERGNFGIGPNFRVYFGRGYGSGFFTEVFGIYYTGDVPQDVLDDPLFNEDNEFSTFALGIGIGNKWLTRSNRFSFELNLGVGRNINPEEWQDTAVPRGAISIGFRF